MLSRHSHAVAVAAVVNRKAAVRTLKAPRGEPGVTDTPYALSYGVTKPGSQNKPNKPQRMASE